MVDVDGTGLLYATHAAIEHMKALLHRIRRSGIACDSAYSIEPILV
jgi:NADP-dependent 3-hydroxy acid dehydrogenase YdfG